MSVIVDLSNMDLEELKTLRIEIDKAIVNAKKVAHMKALAEVQKVAKEHGFSLNELVNRKVNRGLEKSPISPKYCNPDDASQTWSGRGRQPGWFKEALENGVEREKLRV